MKTQKHFAILTDTYLIMISVIIKRICPNTIQREDASYFGNWVNFKSLELITYCEGDLTIIKCENVEKFKNQLLKTVSWYKKNKSFIGIDLMLSDEIKKDFNKLDLDKNYYLHK